MTSSLMSPFVDGVSGVTDLPVGDRRMAETNVVGNGPREQMNILQDEAGNIELTHSISAGLDYAAVGPEHAWLREIGRTEYAYATDAEALEGFKALARYEGIIPALESSHAVWHAMQLAHAATTDTVMLVNLSGRGDKDVQSVTEALK